MRDAERKELQERRFSFSNFCTVYRQMHGVCKEAFADTRPSALVQAHDLYDKE